MKTLSSAYKKALLRKYHLICRQLGITEEEKQAIKDSYGISSSKSLSERQLSDLIDRLLAGQDLSTGQKTKNDIWRKRVMASIGGWLRMIGKPESADTIKAIACRATGYTNFNKIPIARLRTIYYEFRRKSETITQTNQVKNDLIEYLKFSN